MGPGTGSGSDHGGAATAAPGAHPAATVAVATARSTRTVWGTTG
jgi:hypothetical protein